MSSDTPDSEHQNDQVNPEIRRVVDRLRPHWETINQHYAEENARLRNLMEARGSHEALGRILQCHLLIEHYLDRFLIEHFKLTNVGAAKLTYFQKAMLLPDRQVPQALVKPGILQVNTIRNRLAHNLNAIIDDAVVESMTHLVLLTRPNLEDRSPVGIIEAFTTLACTWLVVSPPEITAAYSQALSDVNWSELIVKSDDD